MTSTRFSIAFAVGAMLLTVLIIWRDPFRLVTLGGHGEVVWWAFWITMVTVTFTHAALLTIMGLRYKTWQPVESALFDFIAIDGLFWGTTAWFIRGTASEFGVPLVNVALAALMLVATVRFNVMAVRHYILSSDGNRVPT
jgi:cellobiose phosphorylase